MENDLENLVRDALADDPVRLTPVGRARRTAANISPHLRRYLECDTDRVVEQMPLDIRKAAVIALGSVQAANLWLQLSWETLDWYTPGELIALGEEQRVIDTLAHIRHWRLGR